MMMLLEFWQELVHQLLPSPVEKRQSVGTLCHSMQSCLETPRLRGLFGFLILSFSRSTQRLPNRFGFDEAVRHWQNKSKEPQSTMERLAYIHLTFRNSTADGEDHSLDTMDVHTTCATASALIEIGDYTQSYQYLKMCLTVLKDGKSANSSEHFNMVNELVKCCNTLGKSSEAEALALQALKDHSLSFRPTGAVCCMRTALADSCIGQGRYDEARHILQRILAQSPSVYLRRAVTLRLIKLERRLKAFDMSSLISNAASLAVTVFDNGVEGDMRHEYIDELSSTLYCMQRFTDNPTTSHPTFAGERRATNINTPYAQEWRVRFLCRQIQRLISLGLDHDNWKELETKLRSVLEICEKASDIESIDFDHDNWKGSETKLPSAFEKYEKEPDIERSSSGENIQKMSDKAETSLIRDDVNNPKSSRLFTAESFSRLLPADSDQGAAVVFSPDGKYVASSSPDWTIKLWEAFTGSLHRTLRGHGGYVNVVVFSPDAKSVASGSDDTTIMLWDIVSGAPYLTLRGHSKWVRTIAFSPNGKHIASGSDDKTIRIWDAVTGTPYRTLPGHSGLVEAVVFSPDGKQIASGSHDGALRLWDMTTNAPPKALPGQNSRVLALAFSPDGQQIVAGSRDGSLRLWNWVTGAFHGEIQGHLSQILALTFSSNGLRVISGSYNGTIRLWSISAGAWYQTFQGQKSKLLALAISPDGRRLAKILSLPKVASSNHFASNEL